MSVIQCHKAIFFLTSMRLFRSMKYVRSITLRRDGSKVLFADDLKIRVQNEVLAGACVGKYHFVPGDFSVVSNRIARPGTLSIPSEYTFRTVIYAIAEGKHRAESAFMETLNNRHTTMKIPYGK